MRSVVRLAAAASVLFVAFDGLAQEPAAAHGISIVLDEGACTAFSGVEIRRLVLLELGIDARAAPSPEIRIGCGNAEISIELFDRVHGRRLSRAIPAPSPDDPGRDRILALAASQLVAALDWIVSPAPIPEEDEVVAAPVPRSVAADPQPVRSRLRTFQLLSGVRARDVREPFLAWNVGVAGGIGIGSRLLLRARLAFERARASREAGDIDAHAVSCGLGAAIRFGAIGPFEMRAGAWAHATRVVLKGRPEEGFVGAKATGTFPELELGMGPVIRVSFLEVGLEVQAGSGLFGGKARVEGGTPVRYADPWFGAGLWIGIYGGD